MSVWGYKIYQNDIALDVKSVYIDLLKRGNSDNAAQQILIDRYQKEISDVDDAPLFWFALADTQWTLGRLSDDVKKKALFYIQNDNSIKRWKEDVKILEKRKKELLLLQEKLCMSQPKYKIVSQYKLYKCQWKMYDVYAYPLDSDSVKDNNLRGKYLIFQKIGEKEYYPGHILPVVYVKITSDNKIPSNEEDINKLEYIQVDIRRFLNSNGEHKQEFTWFPIYRISLLNTSKRIIPKKLIYIGNFKNINKPEREFIPKLDVEITALSWRNFDEQIIKRYEGYNLKKYHFWSNCNI